MRTDVAYEAVDFRPGHPLPAVVVLDPVLGGLSVYTSAEHAEFLPLGDEDDDLVDDEANGIVEVRTPEGRVTFQKVTLAEWEDLEPFLDMPKPRTDEEANSMAYRAVLG